MKALGIILALTLFSFAHAEDAQSLAQKLSQTYGGSIKAQLNCDPNTGNYTYDSSGVLCVQAYFNDWDSEQTQAYQKAVTDFNATPNPGRPPSATANIDGIWVTFILFGRID